MTKGNGRKGLIALVVLGFVLISVARIVVSLRKRGAILAFYSQETTVSGYGVLVDDPLFQSGRTRLLVRLDDVALPVLVTYPFLLDFPLRFGDRVWVKARLLPLNPCSSGIGLKDVLVARHLKGWGGGFRFVGVGKVFPLLREMHRFKMGLYKGLVEVYGNSTGPLLAALLMGMRERLPRELRVSFRASGLAHLLAVSGFHVGVVALVVFLLLRFFLRILICLWPRFPISPWLLPSNLAGGLTILMVWAYVIITGGRASALRAALMLSLYLGARVWGRERPLLTAVLLSFAVLVLWDPLFLFLPGFQLTYLAMAGILVILEGCRRVESGFFSKGLSRRGYLKGIATWLAISLFLPLFLWPWIGMMFHRISLAAPVSNLLLTPLASGVIAAGFVWLLLLPLFPFGILRLVAMPIQALSRLFLGGLGWFGRDNLFPWVTLSQSVLMLALILSLLLLLFLGRRRWLFPLPLLLFTVLSLFEGQVFRQNSVVRLTQGERPAILCRCSRGSYLVVPSLSRYLVERCVMPGLMVNDAKEIDEVVVTSSSRRCRDVAQTLCRELRSRVLVPMRLYMSLREELACPVYPLLNSENLGCLKLAPMGKDRIMVFYNEG